MDALGETQYNVSRHLKDLKIAGLVRENRRGRWVFYSLTKPVRRFQQLIVQCVLSLPSELFAVERAKLKMRLSLRRSGKCVVGMKSKKWRDVLMADRKRRKTTRKGSRKKR
jgi:ArsR family transcriptional regulator